MNKKSSIGLVLLDGVVLGNDSTECLVKFCERCVHLPVILVLGLRLALLQTQILLLSSLGQLYAHFHHR